MNFPFRIENHEMLFDPVTIANHSKWRLQQKDGDFVMSLKRKREKRTLRQNDALRGWSTILSEYTGYSIEEIIFTAMDNVGLTSEETLPFAKNPLLRRKSTAGLDTKKMSTVLEELHRIKDILNEDRPPESWIVLPKSDEPLYSELNEGRTS